MSESLFGPDSMTWRINRESVLLLGGRATLLMQLAHPLVAAGVADHSRFRDDPTRRLLRTLETMYEIVFGDTEAAEAAAARVNAVHDHVRGVAPDGTEYSARDPRLLLWVHATLVDSALRVYEGCVASLSTEEANAYYEESKVIAKLFGVPETTTPETLLDLRAWMAECVASGVVVVTPLARELAEPIIRPLRIVPRRIARASAIVTAALLPEAIREGYGLKLGRSRSAVLALGGRAARLVVPRVPEFLRTVPLQRASA
ncbi:MAG: oxygenase MpaB family protein [Actinomycetota bacterium]